MALIVELVTAYCFAVDRVSSGLRLASFQISIAPSLSAGLTYFEFGAYTRSSLRTALVSRRRKRQKRRYLKSIMSSSMISISIRGGGPP